MAVRWYMRWGSLCSVICGLWPANAFAQTAQSYDYLGVTTKMVIGANGEVLSNYDQVLKVIGLPSVSGGASSAIGIDSSGNIRNDAGTTISTGGAWTWAQAGTFTNGLTSPFLVSGGTSVSLAALGFDNVRLGTSSGTPRILLEDSAGSYQIQQDNLAGAWRLARLTNAGNCEAVGCVPLANNDYIQVDPKAKALLPALPYDVDIGSPIKKFRAIYGAELNIETIVSQFIMATMGGRIIVAPTAKLQSDITSTQTTITVDNNNFASGDTGHMEGYGRFEDVLFGSGPTLINRCPTSGSCATADTTTSWAVDSGTLTLNRDVFYQGDASLTIPNTASLVEFNDGTSWMTNGATYTIQVVMRRSDDGAIVPTGSAYRLYCSAVDVASTTIADDLGAATSGHWYRLHGSCTHSTGVGRVGVTNIPTGGVTHNLDQVQVEAGTTMTPWSQFAASYTVTRNRDGSGGNAWVAGSAVVNTGHAGSGMIDLYSTSGAYSGTQIGPTICGNVRNSTTYNDVSSRWCLGQLQGVYGYGSSTFGLAAGDPSATWIAADATNGFRVMAGATQKFRAYADGHLSIVEGAITLDDLGIRIQNTTGVSSDSKAYTFYGSVSHAKRPGMFYTESGGASALSLLNDAGTTSIQTSGVLTLDAASSASTFSLDSNGAVLAVDPADAIKVAGASITPVSPQFPTLGTSGARFPNAYVDALNIGTGTVTINGTAAGDSGGSVTCPGGQAIKSINIRQGIVISLGCGVP